MNLVIDGRAIRQRRQADNTNSFTQGVSNMASYGYNTIRDNVVPVVNSAYNRFSQNLNQGMNQLGQVWDTYSQNLNQGVNQLGQGWNRFTQNLNQQYPYYNSNNNNNNNGYRREFLQTIDSLFSFENTY